MAWKPRSRSTEPNIDPFNAPDPVMPGGEPEVTNLDDQQAEEPEATRDRGDGIERMIRRNKRKEPGHGAHRPRRSSRASDLSDTLGIPGGTGRGSRSGPSALTAGPAIGDANEPDEESVSPIQDEEPLAERDSQTVNSENNGTAGRGSSPSHPAGPRHSWTQQASGTRNSGSTGRLQRKRSTLGCIILAIIGITLLSNVGALLVGCVGSIAEVAGDAFSELVDPPLGDVDDGPTYDYSYDAYDLAQTSLKENVRNVTTEELDRAIAGEEDYVARMAFAFSDAFSISTGIDPSEVGIDANELARQALTKMTYNVESIYAYGDATADGFAFECSSYFYTYAPDLRDLGYDAADYLSDLTSGSMHIGDLSENDRSKLSAFVASELDKLETTEHYEYMKFTATADAEGTVTSGPELDRGAWLDQFAGDVGAYDYHG